MENRQPLVSVITPTYKRNPKFLESVISCVKGQTYKNIEHIIVDDNPPDSEYRKAVKEYMEKFADDPSVVYVENPKNMGASLARNNGIAAAKGEYIAFLDDDDHYWEEKTEAQVNFMIENDCDMSFSNVTAMNRNGKVVDFRDYSFVVKYDKTSLLKYHLMKNLAGTATFMYRTEALKRIGGFDDMKMSQEYMLMLKSIEQGLKIRYLNRSDVCGVRDSEMEQISQGMNKIRGEKRLFEIKKQYYHVLTLRERMYVRFRHQAVMTVAYRRNKMYGKMLLSAFLMCVYSPLDCIYEMWDFVTKILRRRKAESKRDD
ncbi:MAG: glycosyltransferase [Clostridia bacterium]|nr:glycosyltransferase [Clostridia bacterium]